MARLSLRRTRTHHQLRDQLLREVEREGEKILKQMLVQFTSDLSKQAEDLLQSTVGNLTTRSGSNGSFNVGGFDISGLGNLFTTAVSYLTSRPHTTRSTRESSRSQAMADAFRLSQSQAAAEASMALQKAQKNS